MTDARGGKDIHLVLGISSAGKSTYIQQQQASGKETRVVLAYEIADSNAGHLLDAGPCVVHYNMLRPFENNVDHYGRPLDADPVIGELLRRRARITSSVLVVRPSTLAKRLLLRQEHESALRPSDSSAPYPAPSIFEFICRAPVAEIYERWFELLSTNAIPFQILSAETDRFHHIASNEAARGILASKERTTYSEAERRIALGHFTYAYQKFDEIEPFSGGGTDRRPTLEAIRPYLSGFTALDIGCGPGFFCFMLERLGFREVLGTEIQRDRFRAACVIKEVTGSQCSFLLRDVLADPLPQQFDTVLMLNVLHHVRDPIAALQRAARMCSQRLIIEFATLADEKFAATSHAEIPKGDDMPLIGVSLLPGQDQTFLFSQEALRRICLDHAPLFNRIDFTSSPMSPARRLAICSK